MVIKTIPIRIFEMLLSLSPGRYVVITFYHHPVLCNYGYHHPSKMAADFREVGAPHSLKLRGRPAPQNDRLVTLNIYWCATPTYAKGYRSYVSVKISK